MTALVQKNNTRRQVYPKTLFHEFPSFGGVPEGRGGRGLRSRGVAFRISREPPRPPAATTPPKEGNSKFSFVRGQGSGIRRSYRRPFRRKRSPRRCWGSHGFASFPGAKRP
jgi:hypothetical protein